MKRIRRIVAAGLLLPAAGCTALRPLPTPGEYIARERPPRIYVLEADSSVRVIDRPSVDDARITGLFAGTLVPAELPLTGVVEVRARRPSPARTALLVGGIGAALGLVAYLATRRDFDESRPENPFYCEPQCTGY